MAKSSGGLCTSRAGEKGFRLLSTYLFTPYLFGSDKLKVKLVLL